MDPMLSTETIQGANNDWTQVNTGCLGVPVILRVILEHFSTTELLELSLVNKQWNYEARSLIRIRGNLTASINRNHTCQDLGAFVSDLRRMKETTRILPFSGMTITVGGPKCANKDHCQQSPNPELEPVYEEILRSLKWKHLSIRHLVGWEEHRSCPGLILQTKIFRKLDSSLEDLSVQLQSNEANYFKEVFLRDCYFCHLKTFRLLNEEQPIEAEWSDLIKTVVSAAPNLQTLYTKERVDLEANLLEGSSAVHLAGSWYSPDQNEIPENVAREIKLQELDLFKFSPDFSLERFNRTIPMLLQSSRTVMSAINIDVIFLAALIKYGICMENVNDFELALVPSGVDEIPPHIWRVAKSLDFTRMFPKLQTVTILPKKQRSIPTEFNEMIEQVNASLGTPAPDRVANIKLLKLDTHPSYGVLRRSSSFRLIAQMFPDVTSLSILTDEVPSAEIRDAWADLKEVDILLVWSLGHLTNLDSVLCGIFPEEVALLREEDEEYLRRVNIVPVMPCIAYWKELKSFDWDYENHEGPYLGPIDDPTFLFSKVTGFIAFKRCPNLTVILTSEDERLAEALGHLKPYAAVIYKPNQD